MLISKFGKVMKSLVARAIPFDNNNTFSSMDTQSAIEEAKRGAKFRVTQTAHGLTLPSFGILPVYFDNNTQNYVEARGNIGETAADICVVGIPDANTLDLQLEGLLNVNHGLTVGAWYVLDPDTVGNAIRADLLVAGASEGLQYLFYTVSADQIIIRNDPYFVQGDESAPPVPVERVTNWTNSTSVTTGGDTNRALFLWVLYETSGNNQPTQVQLSGGGLPSPVNMTAVSTTIISSGFSIFAGLYAIFESDLADLTGTATLSITYTGSTPSNVSTPFATYKNVNQLTPTSIQTRQSTNGSGSISYTDLEMFQNGLTIAAWISGNTGINDTITSNSTEVIDVTVGGYAAKVYERVPTPLGFDNFELAYTSGNRQILKGVGVESA